MSTIVFMPVCSRCGTVLYSREINYERPNEPESIAGTVSPSMCPVCEAFFSRIVMPAKFPWKAPEPTDNFGPSCFVIKELIDI